MKINDLEVIIEKKKIKNMYLRVETDGSVRVSAPIKMPESEIRAFVLSKLDWIESKKEYFSKRQNEQQLQYITGETHYLWGKPYELEVVYSDIKKGVILDENKIILAVKQGFCTEERKAVLKEWYRIKMKRAVPEVFRRCEKIVGKTAFEWRIKDMRTRWGTCNTKERRIWLNLQLVQKPPKCLEYIIIHELVHLYERHHNDRFYAYMDRFYPDWEEVRRELNNR